MIEYIGGGHGHHMHGCCAHQHDCCHDEHEHYLLNSTISNVEDMYDVLTTHISRKSIHTPKDEIIKLINDSIDEMLNSINDRDYLTIDEARTEFNKLIKQQNFLKEIPAEYITESELNAILDYRFGTIDNAKYCTLAQVQGLLGSYAKKSDLPDLSRYALKTDIVNSTYTLPVATSTALGGIKIGYPASGKNYAVQLDSNNRAFVNVPWTGGTSGGSGDSITITPLLNSGTRIASYSINGESTKYLYAPTSTPGGGSGDDTRYRYYNVSVYRAVNKETESLSKPGSDYTFNYTTNSFTLYPSNWYASPAIAIENYGDKKCQVWVSHNNLCEDGTSTGWTTPVKYYNVDEIIKDAKDEANQYYQQQLTNAESELNSVIRDANNKLAQAQSLLDQFADGDISGIAVKVAELEGSISTYGWNIDSNTSTVTYAEDLFDMVNKKLIKQISESDVDNQTVKSAMETMMADFIKLNVYDYSAYGPIDETYINMTPTQIVLSALGGTSSDNETVDKDSIQSALIDIVKDKITLSIARGSDGAGTSFTLGFDGDGYSKAVLDADNFVVTGKMISNAVETDGLTISEGVANINKEGEAFFGNGTSQFKKDGSGYVAKGNIRWDKEGEVTVNANGTFNGTVYASNGSFAGDVKANKFVVDNNDCNMQLSLWSNVAYGDPTDSQGNVISIEDDTPVFIITTSTKKYVIPAFSIGNNSGVSFIISTKNVLDSLSGVDSIADVTSKKLKECSKSGEGFIQGYLYEMNGDLFTGNIVDSVEQTASYADIYSDASSRGIIPENATNDYILGQFALYNGAGVHYDESISNIRNIYNNKTSNDMAIRYFFYNRYDNGAYIDKSIFVYSY